MPLLKIHHHYIKDHSLYRATFTGICCSSGTYFSPTEYEGHGVVFCNMTASAGPGREG